MLGLLLTFWLISHVAIAPNTSVAISVAAPQSNSLPVIQTPEIPKGEIIEKLVCATDADQIFALYLPSNYSPGRKWPVLYAFDPGARGRES